MKSIIYISIIAASLFKISKPLITASEPVILILFGVCLIGLAKIGRKKFKNEIYKLSGSNHYVVGRKNYI